VNRLEIRPFEEEHLDPAAGLLARRHALHRAAEPLLSARYEEAGAARAELERVWRAPDASGAAAFRAATLVGYVVGAPRANPVWGANVWIEAPGHAVREAEDVRDLYGLAAARWVEEGRTRQYAIVPAQDAELLDAWWRLCFGKQQAHGIQEVPAETTVEVPAGFEIRDPHPEEIEELIELDLALPGHQQVSPVFSGVELGTREELREDWLSALADAENEKILVGSRDGRPVAFWSLVPGEVSGEHRGLLLPERACYLGFAVTLPEVRGSGIGVGLTQASLAWAAEQGYPAMVTDWRVTNLLSSRFWPRRGFRTSFLRLYRSIP
jgi:GNAT superfamily N-acetyltransferase